MKLPSLSGTCWNPAPAAVRFGLEHGTTGGNHVSLYTRAWICLGVHVHFDRVDADGRAVALLGNIFDIALVEEESLGIEMFVRAGCQVDVVCPVGNHRLVELNVAWFRTPAPLRTRNVFTVLAKIRDRGRQSHCGKCEKGESTHCFRSVACVGRNVFQVCRDVTCSARCRGVRQPKEKRKKMEEHRRKTRGKILCAGCHPLNPKAKQTSIKGLRAEMVASCSLRGYYGATTGISGMGTRSTR